MKLHREVLLFLDKQTLQQTVLFIVQKVSTLAISNEVASDDVEGVGISSATTGVSEVLLVESRKLDVGSLCTAYRPDLWSQFLALCLQPASRLSSLQLQEVISLDHKWRDFTEWKIMYVCFLPASPTLMHTVTDRSVQAFDMCFVVGTFFIHTSTKMGFRYQLSSILGRCYTWQAREARYLEFCYHNEFAGRIIFQKEF